MNDLVSKFLSTPATQSWAKSLKDKSGARVGTMLALDPRTPDETAEAMRVGEGLGLPANVVAADVSGFKRQLDQKKNTTALSGAPKTAKWLEDLNNGILAKDDIDNLSWFEKNVEQSPGALTRGVGRGIVRTGAIVPELGARIDAQLVQDVGRTAEAIYQDELKRLGPNASPEMRATARQTAQARFEAVQGMGAEDRAAILQRGAASLSDAREVLDRAAAIPMNETATKFRDETLANAENTFLGTIKAFASDPVGGMSFIAQTAAEVLPILAASTATTAITRSPAAGVGTMSGGSFLTENANSAMEFLAEKGVDLSTPESAALVLDDAELMQEAAERGVTRGLIIAMFDAVSGGIAGQALMKSPMGDVVAQGMSQMVLGGTGEAAAQSASGQEISWQDIVTEGLAELATAPVEVGGVAGRGILRNLSKSADAGTTAAAIDEIDRMAANSKLRERAPDKFAEALDAQGESDFYIAADDLREYFQAKDMEFDAETLEAWGIDPIDFRQAESTGGDVTVSRSAYATRISGTEDAAWFRDNAIRTPGEMSVSQAARFNSEVRDVMDQALADAEDQRTRDLELRDSDVKVYDNVFSQLRAAGRTRDVADNEARVWSSFWRTMADRYGGDPLELAQSMGVQIVGPQTPDAARRRNDLDIKLNTLRSNPQRALRAEGTDLLDFVRSKGGISDTGGDVAAMDAPKGIISETRDEFEARRGQPNMLGLSDSKGTGLDEIGRAAIEAGYFPELMGGSDVQADGTVVDEAAVLLEALQRAISGEAIYPVGEGPNQDMVDLSNELSRRGIDLAMSNDEIAAALEGGGQTLDQVGNREAPLDPVIQSGNAALLVHRAYDKDMKISSETPHWIFDQVSFFTKGYDSYDLSDESDMELLADGSYSQGDGKEVFLLPIDSYIYTSGLSLDAEAAAEIKDLWGAEVDAEALLDGSASTFIEEEIEDGGWHIQRIRAQTGGRAGYDAVVDRDEQGEVWMVDFAADSERLNKALVYAGDYDSLRDGESAFNTALEDQGGLQYDQSGKLITDTPEFRAWFGDSKVVDENGDPLVVYHGTNAEFDAFSLSAIGTTGAAEGYGFYFTDNESIASGYRSDGGKVLSAYLAINKPLSRDAPAFSGDELAAIVREVVSEEIRINPDDVPDYRDGFLSNITDTYSTDIDGAVAEAVLMLENNETAIDQIAEIANIVGSKEIAVSAIRSSTGYDGVYVKDFQDGEGDVYLAWFPEQVKSTENRGTFDANDPRILYQFAGPQSQTANIHSMAAAKDMLARGVSAERTRQETGWFKGADGKWRYEISDDEASIQAAIDQEVLPPFKPQGEPSWSQDAEDANLEYTRSAVEWQADYDKLFAREGIALSDILDHDKLYAAYPDLAAIPVFFNRKMDSLGSVNGMGSEITLNHGKLTSADDFMSTLLHEVQHMIQRREGFARGGNLEMTASVKDGVERLMKRNNSAVTDWIMQNRDTVRDAEYKQGLAQMALMYKSYEALIGYANHPKPSGLFRLIRNEAGWLHTDQIQKRGSDDIQERARELDRSMWMLPKRHKMAERNEFLRNYSFALAQIIRESVPKDIWKALKEDTRQTNSMVKAYEREASRARAAMKPLNDLKGKARLTSELFSSTKYKSPYETYAALSGEVEARNTQSRASMDDAERAETSPTQTADINEGEQIVVFQDGELSSPYISNAVERPVELFQSVPSISNEAKEKALSDHRLSRGIRVGAKSKIWRGVSEESGGGMASYGLGLYTSASKSDAKKYAGDSGRVVEMDRDDLPSNALRFSTINDYEIWFQQAERAAGFEGPRERRAAGYVEPDHFIRAIDPNVDGLQIGSGRDAFFVKWNGRRVFQQEKRGSIQLPSGGLQDGQTVINLFESANLSTFIHESGHFFLEAFTALATSDTAPQGMKDDLAAIHKFLKVKPQTTLETQDYSGPKRSAALDFLAGKIGADIARQRSDDLGDSANLTLNGSTLQIAIREDENGIFLTNIHAKQSDDLSVRSEGSGIGTAAMRALKEYSDETGKPFAVVGSTGSAKPFYEKFDWLTQGSVTFRASDEVMTSSGDNEFDFVYNVTNTAPLTTAQHEMWARGFEAYAMEGKAPSLALADAFGRFKSWLTRIYKTALGLNVKITPEIREVMDRMLATDAEIAAAREMQQMSPLFTSEAAAGMTPAAWETYQKMARRSEEQASQVLLEKTMAKVRREKETWWKDERADVKKEVTTTVDSKPEYRLIEMLANQKWTGSDDPVPDFQIDRAELVETFGDGVLAELSRSRFGGKRAIYGADGISLYEAAEFFGFANPTEMIETLQNTGKKKDAIELETDRIMADRYGDPLNDGSIEEEAVAAIHSDQQAQTVAAEARHLAGQAGKPTRNMTAKVFRQRARMMLSRMSVKDATRPNAFLEAERRSARRAEEAFARTTKGRNAGEALAAAAKHKEQQMLNHYLYMESRDLTKMVASKREKMRNYSKASVREKIGGDITNPDGTTSPGYIQQIDALLEGYDFRVRSAGQIKRSEKLRAFVERMVEEGRERDLDIDERLLDEANRKHYTKMSVEELQGLFDTIENIDHMGRHKQKLVDAKNKRDIQEVADTFSTAISDRFGTGKAANQSKQVRNFFNLLFSVDTMMVDLDGTETGDVYDLFKAPLDRGQAQEQQMNVAMADAVQDIFSVYSSKELSQMQVQKLIPGGNGHTWSKMEIISLALNTGHQDGRNRILEDTVHPERRLTQDQLDVLLDTLEKGDWDFVQSMLKQVNSYWPELAATHKRRKGTELKKVEAVPIETKFGVYPGGYYPLAYDSQRSIGAAKDEASAWDKFNAAGRGSRIEVKSGMTIARKENSGGRTLDFDLNVALRHMRDTIRVITMSEVVDNAARIIKHKDVETAFMDAGQTNQFNTLKLFLDDLAVGPVYNTDPINSFARVVKNNFTMAKLAFNFKTVALQVTGITQSAVVVGKRNMVRGYRDYLANPNAAVQMAMEKSAFMSERKTSFQKDIYDQVNDIQLSSPLAKRGTKVKNAVGKAGFYPMIRVQFLTVDVPTWIAAHDAKLREGATDEAAVKYADRIVARSQGSGLYADRNALERGTVAQNMRQSDFIRLWTTLGSYMVTKMNRGYLAAQKGKRGISEADNVGEMAGSALNMASDLALLYMAEAIMMGLAYALLAGDDADEEDLTKFIMTNTATSVIGGVPIVSGVANAFQGYGAGGVLASVLEMPANVATQLRQGENDAALWRSISDAGGMLTGLPSTATYRAIEGIVRGADEGELPLADMFFGSNPLTR